MLIFPALPWHLAPRHQNAPSGRPTSRRPARCARSEATWGCSIQLREPRDQAPRHSSWGMEKTHRNLRKTMGKTTGKPWEKPWDVHVFLGTIVVYWGYFEENTGWRLWILYPFLLDILGDFSLQLIRGGMRWKHHSSDDHMGKHLFFLIIRIYNNR